VNPNCRNDEKINEKNNESRQKKKESFNNGLILLGILDERFKDVVKRFNEWEKNKVDPSPFECAIKVLKVAFKNDGDLARGWFDNISMQYQDAGCDKLIADEGASRFMRLAFDLDWVSHEKDEK